MHPVKRLKSYLKERDYKLLWHAACILLIIAASWGLFYTHFYTRGTLMHIDMSYPTAIDRNISLYNHMWWQYGSHMNIWNVQRLFWTYPLLIPSKVFRLSNPAYLLLMFEGTVALAGISMYILVFYLFKRWGIARKKKNSLYIGALVAALVYMYNPFSLSHLWPYFGYPAYAVLPLAFMLLMWAVESKSTGSIVLFAVVISISSTGPINVIYFWFMIITYLLFDLLRQRFRWKQVLSQLRILSITLAVYITMGMLWMLPYMYSHMANKPFVPYYGQTMTQKMVDALSAPNTMTNNFRLISGWGMPVDLQPANWLWTILSFLLPVLAVAGFFLLLRMKKAGPSAIYLAMMSIIMIALATGSSSFLRRPYSYIVLRAPGSSLYGWLVRSPDRWLIYLPVFYGVMCAVLVVKLLDERSRIWTMAAAALIILLVISMLPLTLSYAENVYNATKIPSDYQAADNFVQKRSGDDARVLWTPFYTDGFRFYWAPYKRIGAFYIYSSNPSMNNMQSPFGNTYYHWMNELLSRGLPFGDNVIYNKDLMLGDDTVARLCTPFAAQTLIVDNSIPNYKFDRTLSRDGSVKLVKKTKWLDIYDISESPGIVKTSSSTVLAEDFYDNLSISQALNRKDLNNISFINYGPAIGMRYGLIRLKDYQLLANKNPGFEETNELGLTAHWLPEDFAHFRLMSVDTGTRKEGKSSLKVINRSAAELDMNWIQGAPVSVKPGSIYVIQSSVKYENSNWTCALVEGRDIQTGEWDTLIYCPTPGSGTSGWEDSRYSFHVPENIDRLRVRLAAGWVKDTAKGPAVSWFDDVKLFKISDYFFTKILTQGDPPEITYEKLSPEKYIVQVKNAEKPYVLSLSENFDHMWVAKVQDGPTIDSIPLSKTINGFPIDKRGNYQVTIYYQSQGWFTLGLAISLVSLLICLAYLTYWWNEKTGILSRSSRRVLRSVTGTSHNLGRLLGKTGWGKKLIHLVQRAREGINRHGNLVGSICIALLFLIFWWLVSFFFALFTCFLLACMLWRVSSKYLVGASLVALGLCPVMVAINQTGLSDYLAIWALIFLSFGVIAGLVSRLRNPGED